MSTDGMTPARSAQTSKSDFLRDPKKLQELQKWADRQGYQPLEHGLFGRTLIPYAFHNSISGKYKSCLFENRPPLQLIMTHDSGVTNVFKLITNKR